MRFSDKKARLHFGAIVGAALFVAALGACAKPKSYLWLTLESGTPIGGITNVVVDVTQGAYTKTLTYPAPVVTIEDMYPTDLSVSFSGGQSGTVEIKVTLLDQYGCTIGQSDVTTGVIKEGNVAKINVAIQAQSGCLKNDGAAGPDGETFPGCDPVTPQCAAGKTCQVNCEKDIGECTEGGAGGPGSPCSSNADCAPGSQCFDYAGTGCNVKLCLRFCDGDNRCSSTAADGGVTSPDGGAATGVAAVGTKSLCLGPVQCGDTLTSYHTCTFACDPRQPAAAAGTTGCPTGLSCLIVGDLDQVDCACAEKTRTGKDGDMCNGSAQCAPGYICNLMSGVRACRAVCHCNAANGLCTAVNDCANGKTCNALTNDTTFGVCL
ncbi:MAG TPA: hypothetical protein VHJ20_07255 [Polyangia bacterium]|nr:hypothetical protein [Polyangia bacterium]